MVIARERIIIYSRDDAFFFSSSSFCASCAFRVDSFQTNEKAEKQKPKNRGGRAGEKNKKKKRKKNFFRAHIGAIFTRNNGKQQVRSHRECSFHRRRLNRRFFAAVVVARAKPLGSDPFLSSVLPGDAVRGISEFSLSLSTKSNERTNAQKREKERILSLTSSSLASRIFLLSSSDPETKKHLLFFFFLSTHRFKGLSRGGGRCRR